MAGAAGASHTSESVTCVAPVLPTAVTMFVPSANVNGHVKMQLVLVAIPCDLLFKKSSTELQLA